MKSDIMQTLNGEASSKRLSKETLNNPELIRMVSGLDPWKDAQYAFRLAYERLGIDLINRVPLEPAPLPVSEPTLRLDGYYACPLGVYDTFSRHVYPYADADVLLSERAVCPDYERLITPVPHPVDARDADMRQQALGDIGLYYPMLYTTLFMWGVEWLGWETFMIAVMQNPRLFDEKFFTPAYDQTLRLVQHLIDCECPFVVLHDDIADARGPVFPPWFYRDHIFPRYEQLFRYIHEHGKQVIFVADGNMDVFLEHLRIAGADGIMPETPATNFEKVLDIFDGGWIVGGIDTRVLTFGTEIEIADMVNRTAEQTAHMSKFIISSPGGLHGNIPMKNLVAYFDARARNGFTRSDWRTGR